MDSSISIASISAQKNAQVSQEAQVSVLKKQLNQQAEVAAQLIESATQSTPPPGVGGKINITA